jgi:D-lactate dehydrogenase
MSRIVFFEVKDWEIDIYKNAFSECVLVGDPLTVNNARDHYDAEIVSTFIHSEVGSETLALLPNIRGIVTRSTGYDHIDISYCRDHEIKVCNVPEYGTNTVAEHTMALILTLTRKMMPSILELRNPDFRYENLTGVDVFGKTMGIIGLGKIGSRVAQIARAFGMNVVVYNRTQKAGIASQIGFAYVGLQDLLRRSDIVTLHMAHNPETHHILNMENISLMKKGSFLVNTARGGLIQTDAIIYALQMGILAGVGLDVLEAENDISEEAVMLETKSAPAEELKSLLYDYILLRHPKVVVTPHNAFNSREALDRIANVSVDNVRGLLTDKKRNMV